jgi:SAM-dependent methyltransferase
MIRTTQVQFPSHPTIFRPHSVALTLCTGQGLEIGAAAHNPFGLDARNVAPYSEDVTHPWHADFELYKAAQIAMCGSYAEVDIPGTADNIAVEDESQDFVISSHVIEHIPSPVSALLEWDRILRKSGIIFIIYPKYGAHANDLHYPLSTVEELISAFAMKKGQLEAHQDHHPWRLTPYIMQDLVNHCVKIFDLRWSIIFTEDTDSKVGNGHTIAIRKDEEEYS